MVKTDLEYQNLVKILEEELLPAMGCTEPIAVAYCAAIARETLGETPDRVVVEASGNIIKNVKSVVVPNTGGLHGIPAAAAAGVVAGDASKQLEVIASVTDEKKAEIKKYLETAPIEVKVAQSDLIFDIIITVYKGESYAKVRIVQFHTNVVLVEKNGEIISSQEVGADSDDNLTDRSFMTVEKILDFANTVEIEDVKALLDVQIAYNMAISEEGLANSYGANIGSVLLKAGEDVMKLGGEAALRLKARAMAAAGSDARMSGCELPVIINSGSGNQGITASVPVVVYAQDMGATQEQLYRALVVSNLVTRHLKSGIGPLSAYCGAISAGCGAAAGITYLYGGKFREVAHTLVNALAINSGVICDGAKASCAAKIASAVEAGILGMEMFRHGSQFLGGDGIVKKGVENTIRNVGQLASQGMRNTDAEIIKIILS